MHIAIAPAGVATCGRPESIASSVRISACFRLNSSLRQLSKSMASGFEADNELVEDYKHKLAVAIATITKVAVMSTMLILLAGPSATDNVDIAIAATAPMRTAMIMPKFLLAQLHGP